MPVKRDETGRRFVQAETEVPGTPEQVWDAIATGHGISSWFVPTDVEERKGGKVISHFSPDGTMDAVATITEWDPPRRMSATGQDAPNGPAIATEWTVEARGGGTCTVRVVHSWFASTDDWDKQFEQHEKGWLEFFEILRLYLEHFAGQRSAAWQVMGFSKDDVPAAWPQVVTSLGIGSPGEGEHIATASDAPPLAGRVIRVGTPEHPQMLVLLDQPGPGVAHIFAMKMGDQTCLAARGFFYGDGAADVVARSEPRWQQWMQQITQPA